MKACWFNPASRWGIFKTHPEAILEHLGRWPPEAMARSPPVPPEAWPANARFALTYHPVPDIA